MIQRLSDELIPEDLGAFYEAVAASGERTVCDYRWPMQTARRRRVVEYVSSREPRRTCLEIGCAEGAMTRYLAPLFERIDALEISPTALGRAPELANVRWHLGDVRTWEPVEAGWDVVVASEVLEHVPDALAVLRAYLPRCRWLVVSLPVTEAVNTVGVFDASLVGVEERQADATGHIWYLDADGLREWGGLLAAEFDLGDHEWGVEEYGDTGILVMRGTFARERETL